MLAMNWNDKTLSGSAVAICSKGFIPWAIRYNTRWIALWEGDHWEPYSHVEILRWDEDTQTLMTFGARGKGTEESVAAEYYPSPHIKNIRIQSPNVPLTRDDNYLLKGFYIQEDPKKYQYANFLWFILDVHLFGKLPEKVFATKLTNYCYKLGARAIDYLGRWYGVSTEKVAINFFFENPKYHEYEPSNAS